MATPSNFTLRAVDMRDMPPPAPPRFVKKQIYSDPRVFEPIDTHAINVSIFIYTCVCVCVCVCIYDLDLFKIPGLQLCGMMTFWAAEYNEMCHFASTHELALI